MSEQSAPVLRIRDFSGRWQRDVEVAGHGKGRGVSLDVHAGDWVAVIGDNGMGKSTWIAALAGLTPFSSGDLFLRGKLLKPKNQFQRFRESVVYVGQDAGFPANASDDHLFRFSFRNRPSIANEKAVAGLLECFAEAANLSVQQVRALPTRILEFVVAVASIPDVLIIDEIGPAFLRSNLQIEPYEFLKRVLPESIVFFVDHDRQKSVEISDFVVYFSDVEAKDALSDQDTPHPAVFLVDQMQDAEKQELMGDQAQVENYIAGSNTFKMPREESAVELLGSALQTRAGLDSKSHRKMREQVKINFPFIYESGTTVGQLSGGQKVILASILNAILYAEKPPQDVLQHLSAKNVKRLNELLEDLIDVSRD